MAQTVTALIERITFHNPETGFAVLRAQVRGRRGLSTVVGPLPAANAGEYIEATGEWVFDKTYGEQFRATHIASKPPTSAEGIEKYLASGLVKGIGPKYAKRIVEVFGERTLEVIDESPAYLSEVKGLGPKRIQLIRESWREQKSIRDIMVFLQSHGLGTSRAVRIYKTYGDKAVELVRANPYRLATDIWGIGFKTADELAEKLGIDPQSPLRARAALRYVLQKLSQDGMQQFKVSGGHVGYPEEAVVAMTAECVPEKPIPAEVVRDAVEQERVAGDIVREPGGEQPWLYLKPLFLAELGLARSLVKLAREPHPLGEVHLDNALAWVEKKMGLELAPLQREAIHQATQQKVLVVTGGPGTGKSTIVRGILEIFAARKRDVKLCAPTGRAAKRLTETTGREAKTIHRLLEFDPSQGGFKKDANARLDLDLLVVDEASMVDVVLMYQLVRALPSHGCLVLVGDVDQLPSVGPGRVLADVIASGAVPVVRLTQIFRQAGASHIVRAAHAVNQGELPESSPAGQGDFYFVEASTPEAVTERIMTMVTERIPKRFGLDPVRDVQVLSPRNGTELGVEALNLRLQAVLNPPRGGPEVERAGARFRPGDKVMQTQNNYNKEVFNGDIGRVLGIDEEEREVVVDFDGRPVPYDYNELDELSHAFAISIHKGQGSEYPAVIIPVHTQHFTMLKRNLLYTGITRGKKLVALVGTKKALEIAVQRQDTESRCSALARRLQELQDKSPEVE